MSWAAHHGSFLRVGLLLGIALIAFGARLFSVLRYESIIHEFDPWFNYRATKYLVENGWYSFLNWFDELAWYPLGRNVGTTTFPGMLVTSTILHHLANRVLLFGIELRDICVLIGPLFGALTTLVTYGIAKELADSGAALVAALLMSVCPSYISRSVAGSYDYEAIAIFQMMTTFYCWIRASKRGSAIWAVLSALCYFYMASTWGGYVYVTNLIPLHTLTLLVSGRYSHGLYRAYSTFFVLGTAATLTVPFVGFSPISSTEQLPARGMFLLMQLWALANVIRKLIDNDGEFRRILKFMIILGSILGIVFAVGLSLLGFNVLGPLVGRFYSLFNTEYAKKHMPIIASVSEHQPTPWASYFFDLHLSLIAAPFGMVLCWKYGRIEHMFAIVFALTAVYFSSVMVRLMLILAPIVCILGGIAISHLIDVYTPGPSINLEADNKDKDKKKEISAINWDARAGVIGTLMMALVYYVWHCGWVISMFYSSPSIMLATNAPQGGMRIIDDFREAYYWLRRNTDATAKVLSWWDYGYQIAGMADRTTMVDNNTWNNTHIAKIGQALALGENASYPVLRQLDTDYLLVLSGAVSAFSGDDINKFLWMVRISSNAFPGHYQEKDFYSASGEYRVDEHASEAMKNSIMYKMVYYGLTKAMGPQAIDRARGAPLKNVDPQLSIMEEAYSTDNQIVRIYKLKKPDVLGRSLFKITK